MNTVKIYTPERLLEQLELNDFDLFILIAVGSHSFLHEEIEAIYNEKKEHYYQLFKESKYYKHPYLLSLSAMNYRGIQQFCGIYLEEKSLKKNTITLQLIKKGYKMILNYLKNKSVVEINELQTKLLEYTVKNSFESTISSFSYFAVTIYLCQEYQTPLKCDEYDIQLLNECFSLVKEGSEVPPVSSSNIDQFLTKYAKMGIKKKSFKLPLNDFIANIGKIDMEEKIKDNPLVPISEEELELSAFNSPIFLGINKIAYLLQLNRIDVIDLQNITTITYEKLNTILSISALAYQQLNLSESFDEIVGMYLILDAIFNEYKTIKMNFLVNSYEDKLLELVKIQENYQEKIADYDHLEAVNKKSMHLLNTKLDESNARINELELMLKKERHEVSQLNKKLTSLQEKEERLLETIHMYDQLFSEINPEQFIHQEMVNQLDIKRCIVIGGSLTWQRMLKEKLPNWKFYTPDELNRDFSFMTSTDCIFFNSSINSHGMYYKIKQKVESTGATLYYCGGSTNLYLTLSQMYHQLYPKNCELL